MARHEPAMRLRLRPSQGCTGLSFDIGRALECRIADWSLGSGVVMERRLAAIFAADVAAYSRLIGADEEGTLERLRAHRRELIDPKIAEHQGRIVKTTG